MIKVDFGFHCDMALLRAEDIDKNFKPNQKIALHRAMVKHLKTLREKKRDSSLIKIEACHLLELGKDHFEIAYLLKKDIKWVEAVAKSDWNDPLSLVDERSFNGTQFNRKWLEHSFWLKGDKTVMHLEAEMFMRPPVTNSGAAQPANPPKQKLTRRSDKKASFINYINAVASAYELIKKSNNINGGAAKRGLTKPPPSKL